MKKTYLVTVDVLPKLEALLPDDEPVEFVITAALNHNSFLHCHSVTLAPESFQPINTEGTPSA